ncbi:uncharacterized protein LOC142141018 [Mixophyes fleayi]|uniref:uncharacterized protein LOC142141018 n=1 Tax=Mixophyes fleayi TaxID=3061075 RepID=UPI003F4E299F
MSLWSLGLCAFCHKGAVTEKTGEMLKAPDEEIMAHYNCVLFSPAVVSSESGSQNIFGGFDITTVKKEIKRGNGLKCVYCYEYGASVGCDIKSCKNTYHFICVEEAGGKCIEDLDNQLYIAYCDRHKDTEQAGVANNELDDGPHLRALPSTSEASHGKTSQKKKRRKREENNTQRKRQKTKETCSTEVLQNAKLGEQSEIDYIYYVVDEEDNMEAPGTSASDRNPLLTSDSHADDPDLPVFNCSIKRLPKKDWINKSKKKADPQLIKHCTTGQPVSSPTKAMLPLPKPASAPGVRREELVQTVSPSNTNIINMSQMSSIDTSTSSTNCIDGLAKQSTESSNVKDRSLTQSVDSTSGNDRLATQLADSSNSKDRTVEQPVGSINGTNLMVPLSNELFMSSHAKTVSYNNANKSNVQPVIYPNVNELSYQQCIDSLHEKPSVKEKPVVSSNVNMSLNKQPMFSISNNTFDTLSADRMTPVVNKRLAVRSLNFSNKEPTKILITQGTSEPQPSVSPLAQDVYVEQPATRLSVHGSALNQKSRLVQEKSVEESSQSYKDQTIPVSVDSLIPPDVSAPETEIEAPLTDFPRPQEMAARLETHSKQNSHTVLQSPRTLDSANDISQSRNDVEEEQVAELPPSATLNVPIASPDVPAPEQTSSVAKIVQDLQSDRAIAMELNQNLEIQRQQIALQEKQLAEQEKQVKALAGVKETLSTLASAQDRLSAACMISFCASSAVLLELKNMKAQMVQGPQEILDSDAYDTGEQELQESTAPSALAPIDEAIQGPQEILDSDAYDMGEQELQESTAPSALAPIDLSDPRPTSNWP